jgi:alpha-1,2-glucosyltransferase
VSLLCLAALLAVVAKTYEIRQTTKQHKALARHSALDVTLFPPLFFFSALYYTDLPSTLSVLVFYLFFLYSYGRNISSWLRISGLVSLGAVSLLFRQTNIFWIAVFPAGIVLVNGLDSGHHVVKDSMHRRAEGFGDSMMSVVRTCWKMEVIFDPTVRDAWFEGTSLFNRKCACFVNVALDYIKTIISIVASGVKAITQPKRITILLTSLAPYMLLISSFAGFVLWNGGVVLGDKNNHITTVHLPQMLYIWPYFTFFSWPLLYPYLAALPIALLAKMPNIAPLEGMLMFKRRHLAPRTWLLGLFIALACLTVHFNTIVHPFTLADNRHYTFYVFRLLMRPHWVKYAVTPIYIMCGWACIQALSARPLSATRPPSSKDTNPARSAQIRARPLALPDGTNSATTSFVLIWLATTTLQLVTAPLVEPRYLILPWIFWRMHVPLQQYSPAPNTFAPALKKQMIAQDHRLWFETARYLLVNAVTGYVFLKWKFTWPQEPGEIQRFMW